MRHTFLFLTTFFLLSLVWAQEYDGNHPPNTFRSAKNPYYWKNKSPHPGYWQQDVYYKIKAVLDEKSDQVKGDLELSYWNNSPDTLYEAFFQLYQNAFEPESYYANLRKNNRRKNTFGSYTSQHKGTDIIRLTDGAKALPFTIDNTVMKVKLHRPLLPGDSCRFEISFITYFDNAGNIRRRMKTFNAWGYKHYDLVHWYPSIAVYDRKFGWCTDQHMGHEFYHDFGTFDVKISLANNMIAVATGTLQNRDEVLPEALYQKIQRSRFDQKEWNSPPSVIIPYDSSAPRKVWHYYAENVHNFALSADPTYRLDRIQIGKTEVIAAVQEPHAAGWKTAARYTAAVVKINEKLAGEYAWPKIVVADARDGMEYPMLTLDGGFDPFYRDLLAHEVSHMWFYGMVANNEEYRAALDEGFTQFLSTETLRRIEGEFYPYPSGSSHYEQKHRERNRIIDGEVYYAYLKAAIRDNDARLNTHSDDFNGALRHDGGYRLVYFKTATMLYNLKYVLGEELFWKSFRHYFQQWSFCHPYFEDFRQSIIDYTKVDLNWFFDQWLTTKKKLDYTIKGIKPLGGDRYEIKLKRKEEMQMPIDLRVISSEDTLDYYIPNTWFEKKSDAIVLPRWIGWGKNLKPEYRAEIEIKGKIRDVIIDPSGRLADINRLDNHLKLPIKSSFDYGISQRLDYEHYRLEWRPDIWFNRYDGLKAGLHFEGDYFGLLHRFSLTAWYNSGLLQNGYYSEHIPASAANAYDKWSFKFRYNTPLAAISRKSQFNMEAAHLDGLDKLKLGFSYIPSRYWGFSIYYKSLFRNSPFDLNYLLYPTLWQPARLNTSLNIELKHHYRYPTGDGSLNFALRSSSILSDFDYNYAQLESINKQKLGKLDIHTRFFARFGSGSNVAPESALYMAMGSPENMMENKFLRASGFFPQSWTGIGKDTRHFQYGGGLNLRGYNGYFVVQTGRDGQAYHIYRGKSGLSGSVELDFDRLISFSPRILRAFHLDSYLFADAGSMLYREDNGQQYFSDIRADAGLGFALTIKKFLYFDKLKPFTVRADFPLLLTHTPNVSPEFFQFRWLIGLERSF